MTRQHGTALGPLAGAFWMILATVPLLAGSADAGAAPTPRAVLALPDCQRSTLRNALDNLPAAGGVIELPAQDCDWGSQTISVNLNGRNLWLRGAGSQGATRTVLRRSNPAHASQALTLTCSGNEQVEVSDLAFEGAMLADSGGTDGTRLEGALKLDGGCQEFKLHDLSFDRFSKSGIEIRGADSRGVIYDSRFTNNYNTRSPGNGEGYGVVVYENSGSAVPRAPLALGSGQAVFIEDNYFKANRHSIASNSNSRYVVRHNDIIQVRTTRGTAAVDAHGRGAYPPGSRSWEIYNNYFYYDAADPAYPGSDWAATGIGIRGGDGVVFGNLLDGSNRPGNNLTIRNVMSLTSESSCSAAAGTEHETVQAHLWGNSWQAGSAGGELDDQGNPIIVRVYPSACNSRFREGHEYHLLDAQPDWYTSFPYPHYLRLEGDAIFADGFEE